MRILKEIYTTFVIYNSKLEYDHNKIVGDINTRGNYLEQKMVIKDNVLGGKNE